MYFNFKRKLLASIVCPLLALLVTALTVGTYTVYRIEDTITSALCPPIIFESLSDVNAAEGFELSKQIVSEGSILVKNDNNVLPLNKDSQKKVNVFGHGSIDWIIGGSGSGQIQKEQNISNILFLDALKSYGIEYNTQLTDMYTNFCGAKGTVDSLNKFYNDYYILYEPGIDSSYYTDAMKNTAKNFSDTALVVISRRAGETEDPPRHQNKHNASRDNTRHYLEISTEEEGLLKYVGSNYENVVVIINSTNTMELDFLKTIPGLDACLIVGATGTRGAAQIPYILYGDNTYPSGRTVDTYPFDFKYNVNYGYTGIDNVHHYTNASGLYPEGVSRNAGVSKSVGPSYVDYVEGVYVGYKWFETADAEGYWDKAPYNGYENVVQFPFGYGLSYTTFDWKLNKVFPEPGSEITNLDEIVIDVDVTNTGNFSGKDVIEAYVTAPYTKGGIEKAYVSLVGICKTPEIKPGETMKVTVKIPVKEFESYDCYDKNTNGHKGYELEAGEYEVKLMTDSHNVKKIKDTSNSEVDGILTYKVRNTIKVETDEVTGNKVENRFTGETAEGGISIDGSDSKANIPYISRGGFPELSKVVAPSDRAMTSNVAAWNIYSSVQASKWDNDTKDIFGKSVPTSNPKWGVGSGNKKLFNNDNITALGLKLGKDYNDPEWDSVLDSVKFDEAVRVTGTASWSIAAIDSVGKPKTSEYDGPAQVRSFNAGTNPGTGFPCGTVLAQTWSTTVGYNFGINYGKEMSAKAVDGAYAFGCNIHRSPFQGRNYEYLSECGNLTAFMLVSMVQGLQNTGKYCFLKHLAIAETEYEREAMYTWLSEQTFREIYLKPFQRVIQDANCVGIMSSYNRVGGIWTGGSEQLLEGILRYEWGFKGAIITDYADHVEFMNGGHSNRAGGNLGLNTNWSKVSGFSDPSSSSTPRLQHRLRAAVKQILYMMCYVKYANDQYNKYGDSNNQIVSYSSLQSWIWWKPALTSINICAGGLVFIGLYLVFRPTPTKRIRKEDEINN